MSTRVSSKGKLVVEFTEEMNVPDNSATLQTEEYTMKPGELSVPLSSSGRALSDFNVSNSSTFELNIAEELQLMKSYFTGYFYLM